MEPPLKPPLSLKGLTGPRVIVRQWAAEDLEPFVAMNADPAVTRFFPKPSSRQESLEVFARLRREIEERGWGLFAVEYEGRFIGSAGLAVPKTQFHFMPCVEIGYRFLPTYWGQGLALEAARLVLQFGFRQLALREIVAYTARRNVPSQRLMQRLGMTHSPGDDFDHPNIPDGHFLRPHVLYRIQNGYAATC
jgi:RimJ/RimL family protein N-acetyltransferase